MQLLKSWKYIRQRPWSADCAIEADKLVGAEISFEGQRNNWTLETTRRKKCGNKVARKRRSGEQKRGSNSPKPLNESSRRKEPARN